MDHKFCDELIGLNAARPARYSHPYHKHDLSKRPKTPKTLPLKIEYPKVLPPTPRPSTRQHRRRLCMSQASSTSPTFYEACGVPIEFARTLNSYGNRQVVRRLIEPLLHNSKGVVPYPNEYMPLLKSKGLTPGKISLLKKLARRPR